MSDVRPERLADAVADLVVAGDAAGVLALLRDAPERVRSATDGLLPAAVRARRPDGGHPDDVAHVVSRVCLQSPREAAWAGAWALHRDEESTAPVLDLVAAAVATRPPAWRVRYLRAAGQDLTAGLGWSVASRLAAAGAIDAATVDAHLPALWEALSPLTAGAALARGSVTREHLWASLRADRTGTRLSWRPRDVPAAQWWDALVAALGADVPDQRERLVGECLVRLRTVRTAPEARGFLDLLAHLAPTDDEIVRHQGDHLALATAPVPGAVAVGQEAVRRLVALGRLDAEGFLDATADVLARREKGVVRAQVRLVDRAVRAGAVHAGAAAAVLADALDPARPDLAVATAAVLRRCAAGLTAAEVGSLRDTVAQRAPEPWPELAATLGPDLAAPAPEPAATGDDAAPSGEAPADGTGTGDRAPVAGATPVAAPVDLPAPGAVPLVTDVDELGERVARLLEDPEDAVGLEVALAGMLRLRDVRPVAAAALLRRASQREHAWVPRSVGRDLVGLVAQWLDPTGLGRRLPPAPPGLERSGFARSRADVPAGAASRESTSYAPATGVTTSLGWSWTLEVHARVPAVLHRTRLAEVHRLLTEPPGRALLATPTRTDGSLDGDTLLRRLAAQAQHPFPAPARRRWWSRTPAGAGAPDPAVHDLAAALLRLDPADRDAVAASGALEPDAAAALREPAAAWCRVTAPVQGYRQVPAGPASVWQRTAPPGAGAGAALQGWTTTDDVVGTWWDSTHGTDWDRSAGAALAGWVLALPHDPDLLAAHLQPALALWLEKPRASFVPVAAALGATARPLGGPAASALVWLAAFGDVTVRTAAAEAVAAAAHRGTLTGATLGAQLVEVLGPDAGPFVDAGPKANRVAATLADAATLGDAAERTVLDALVVLLPVVRGTRAAADLLELTARLAETRRTPVPLPPGLAAVTSRSTRVAVAARRLRDVTAG